MMYTMIHHFTVRISTNCNKYGVNYNDVQSTYQSLFKLSVLR